MTDARDPRRVSEPLEIVLHTGGLEITGEDPVRLALGGSETAVVSLARALARLGHRVTVSCNTREAHEVDGVGYLPGRELPAHLRRQPADVLVSSRHHEVLGGPVEARLAVLWHHDMLGGSLVPAVATGLARAELSVFVSAFQLAAYEARFPGLGRCARVLPNGVDLGAAEEARRLAREVAEEPSAPRFVFASRPERGLAVLLETIWPELHRRWPEAELLVAAYDPSAGGTGELSRELERLYAHCRRLLAAAPGVRHLGALPRCELWRRMAASTAVLYPTDWPETSCMVALEAQALGAPIVTSDRFALSETVAFGETLVGEPWGSAAYAERFVGVVRRLVEDAGFHRRASEAGRRHVSRSTHSWEALAERWSGLFERSFRERFERSKAGVLRRLLADGDLEAAGYLVRREDASVFDPLDLRDLEKAVTGTAGSVEPAGTTPAAELERRLLRTPPRPKVTATLLVKDEAANLQRSIESFAAVVDEILIGDTGSSDQTPAICELLGFERAADPEAPRRGRRTLLEVPFEGFAEARNALAAHAESDYLFWQDADEVLVGAEQLRRWVDSNVYYDAFAIEQRNLLSDGRGEPQQPLRCFRPQTADGPLGWVGCVHETVEHGADRLPARVLRLPGIYAAHTGYLHEEVRRRKALERNWPLFLEDRRRHPGRSMGYVLAVRECLHLARWEIEAAGTVTRKAYRHLNLGFEIWHQKVRHMAPPYRQVAWGFSRQILATLARHELPLERSGQIPFEADFAFAARRGGLELDSRDVPHNRTFYADVDELRRELKERLDALERDLPRPFATAAGLTVEEAPAHRGIELPRELFDLDDVDGGEDRGDGEP